MSKSTQLDQSLEISPKIEASIQRKLFVIGVLVFGLSLTVIYGWMSEIEILKRVLSDRVSMKFNTAIGFSFLGLTLMCLTGIKMGQLPTQFCKAARIFAGCAGLIGLVTGAQYLMNVDLGIDQLIFSENTGASSILPGRMSPTSALCLTLLGLTFSLLGTSKKHESLAQIICFLSLLISYAVLIGYLLRSPQLYGIERLNTMAIHSSIAFLLLSIAGIFFYHNHRYIAIALSPTPAGYVSRRLLPFIFLGPIAFAWLRWTFISEDWLEGKMSTALLTALAAGFTSIIANLLVWKMHEQYSLKRESEAKIEEQNQLLAWREKLVSTLVHDLRTPMTSARLVAELFTNKPNFSLERIQDLGQRMTKAIDRSDRLLRDLLDSTRAMAGILPHLNIAHCNLKKTLEKALDSFQHQQARLNLICSEEIEGTCSEDAIIRIVENLVSNALKYGDMETIVTIEVTQENPEEFTIRVQNWGKVIPRTEQQGLFDLFSRRSDVGFKPGWGIGLVTVQALTESLGGKVSLSSSPAHGTEFFIRIPTGETMGSHPDFKRTQDRNDDSIHWH